MHPITQKLRGSIVALVTPFTPDGEVDFDALDALVDWHIEQGTHGIVAAGTTGEAATLTVDEHIAVVASVVKSARGRVAVIAGTGANSTPEAINLTRLAAGVGADAALIVAPYYNKPPQEGLYQHYAAIARAVSLPQIIYNVPSRTVVDIDHETMVRLGEFDNIVAMKDATGDLMRATPFMRDLGTRMVLLSGDDPTAIELGAIGAVGNISVTANVAPKLMAQAFDALLAGDMTTARKIYAGLLDLHQALFVQTNPIAVKYALGKMGKISPHLRLPLVSLDSQYHARLDDVLARVGVI